MTHQAHSVSRVVTAVVAMSFAMVGCSTSPMVRTAINANLVQEEAHNQLLALNIARAVHRMPMHFMQVSGIRGSTNGMPFNYGGGLEFSLGGDASNAIKFTPNFGSTQNIDVAILNSQEFMQGMTHPVSAALMLYFLEQGWNAALVLHVFLSAIEIYEKDGTDVKLTVSLKNSPDLSDAESDDSPGKTYSTEHANNYKAFRHLVWGLADCGISSDAKRTPTHYTGVLDYSSLKDLKAVAAAKAAGLLPIAIPASGAAPAPAAALPEPSTLRFATELVETHLRIKPTGRNACQLLPQTLSQIVRPESKTGGATDNASPAALAGSDSAYAKSAPGAPAASAGSASALAQRFNHNVMTTDGEVAEYRSKKGRAPEQSARLPSGEAAPPADAGTGNGLGDTTLRFVMRSPEAMVYYLGELSRLKLDRTPAAELCLLSPPDGGGRCRKLFEMKEVTDAEPQPSPKVAFTVEYRGQRYSVETFSRENRSVQTLALLTQILALQNKGILPPVTTTVRVL